MISSAHRFLAIFLVAFLFVHFSSGSGDQYFVKLTKMATKLYDEAEYSTAIVYFESASERFVQERSRCRDQCTANLEEKYAQSFNYLQFSEFRRGEWTSAISNAEKFSYLRPEDETMAKNLEWYHRSAPKSVDKETGNSAKGFAELERVKMKNAYYAQRLQAQKGADKDSLAMQGEIAKLRTELEELRDRQSTLKRAEMRYKWETAKLYQQLHEHEQFLEYLLIPNVTHNNMYRSTGADALIKYLKAAHDIRQRAAEKERERERKREMDVFSDDLCGTEKEESGSCGGEENVLRTPEPTILGVDRRSNLSFSEFYTEYALKKRPVVITDYAERMNDTLWDLKFFRDTCGHHTAWVRKAVEGAESWGGLKGGAYMKVSQYIQQVLDGTIDPSLYLHDWPLTRGCPEALKSFNVPKYFAQDWMQRVPNAKGHKRISGADAWPSLFIGRRSTGSALHVDTQGTNFWMYLISGRKRWRFVDPGESVYLYEDRDRQHFRVDAMNPDVEKYPLFRLASYYDTTLYPGELLFVPAGSPHQVYNVDHTVAVSMNYVDGSNIEMAKREHKKAGDAGYGGSLQFYRELSRRDFPTYMNMQQEDMPFYSEFKEQYLREMYPSYYA